MEQIKRSVSKYYVNIIFFIKIKLLATELSIATQDLILLVNIKKVVKRLTKLRGRYRQLTAQPKVSI